MPGTDKNAAGSTEKNVKSESDTLSPVLNAESPQDIRQLLAGLLGEEGKGVAIQVRRQMESYSGPLPHPKHLAEYRKDCPDILERSLAMAERGQAAEIENSRLQLENERLALENERDKTQMQRQHDMLDSRDTARAQYLGFAALMTLAALAAFSAYLGHEKTAIALIGAIGVLGAMFIGKFSRINASIKKSE